MFSDSHVSPYHFSFFFSIPKTDLKHVILLFEFGGDIKELEKHQVSF